MTGTLNSTRLRSQWSLDGKLLCLHVGIIRHKKGYDSVFVRVRENPEFLRSRKWHMKLAKRR
jgi:hypothetical protein